MFGHSFCKLWILAAFEKKMLQEYFTQSPIIKNGPIRNGAKVLGKFKERMLSRSKLSNA